MPSTKTVNILLVEDNVTDVELTKEAMVQAKLDNSLHVVSDGEQAINYLFKKGEYKDAVRPDLILLDLNLPKVSGHEVLAVMKGHNELKNIPVIVLTSSKAKEDIMETYNLSANCYVTKPLDFDQFLKIVNSIEDFWFNVVCLPKI